LSHHDGGGYSYAAALILPAARGFGKYEGRFND
jgi:hypothetical protein